MVAPVRTSSRPRALQDDSITLKFGGGIHSSAAEDEIDSRECVSGKNFRLETVARGERVERSNLKNRQPFDKRATAPNAGAIRGFATLQKANGDVSMLVQAGTQVYPWDGSSFGSSVGTVNSSARLRGPLEANWQLADKVIITDLGLQEPVKEWNGTTLTNIAHNLGGSFRAKYCQVVDERAFYANVVSGSPTPHLLVASEQQDYASLTVANRPSSSLGDGDPFFLVSPDLKPINGLVDAFGRMVFSTQKGNIYYLTGATSKDYAVSMLHPMSGADGDSAIAFIGNDVVYARPGVIESLVATDQFGDTALVDLSQEIATDIEGYGDWTIAYNSRTQKVYCYPDSQSEMWVLHKNLIGSGLSPWARYTTLHASSFNPTAMMRAIDPSDGLEKVFFGDSSGNLYVMEGVGSADGGTADIQVERLSGLFSLPYDAEVFDLQGIIQYRKNEAATVTLVFEFAGESVFNETVTISLPAVSGAAYFGGSVYFGGSAYFGASFFQRLTRRAFSVPGQSNGFQVRVRTEGTANVEIAAIELRFSAAT